MTFAEIRVVSITYSANIRTIFVQSVNSSRLLRAKQATSCFISLCEFHRKIQFGRAFVSPKPAVKMTSRRRKLPNSPTSDASSSKQQRLNDSLCCVGYYPECRKPIGPKTHWAERSLCRKPMGPKVPSPLSKLAKTSLRKALEKDSWQKSDKNNF